MLARIWLRCGSDGYAYLVRRWICCERESDAFAARVLGRIGLVRGSRALVIPFECGSDGYADRVTGPSRTKGVGAGGRLQLREGVQRRTP